jgi:hypothetical protein|tara:strand:- start:1179 stop:1757 length:579 start_codon:yes stop_codon:yes gene_type:complete
MKINVTLRVICVLVVLLALDGVSNKQEEQIDISEVSMPIVEEDESDSRKDILRFLEAIALFESNNRYDVINPYGFLGRYQFSPTTIRHLGYDILNEEFLRNARLQDEIMLAYMRENYVSLRPYIEEYNNTNYKGMHITTSSILAGAHFAGAMGMKRFLLNKLDSIGTVDANGMTLRRYMTKFSDYNVEEVEG